MTKDTRQAILDALMSEDAENTINGVAEAVDLSYGQAYRAIKELAESGFITAAGETETGATMWILDETASTDLEGEVGSSRRVRLLEPHVHLGEEMKVVAVALDAIVAEDSDDLVLELETGEGDERHRIRALLLEV